MRSEEKFRYALDAHTVESTASAASAGFLESMRGDDGVELKGGSLRSTVLKASFRCTMCLTSRRLGKTNDESHGIWTSNSKFAQCFC